MIAGTKYGLTQSEVIVKTDLMARTWQAHSSVSEAIEEFLKSDAADCAKLRTAHRDYLNSIMALERFASCVASRHREAHLNQTAARHSKADDEAAQFWIAAYAAFSFTLANLPPLGELEYPSDELLTAFEELPDSP